MVKRFRADEVARRIGLPESIVHGFVDEGLIRPCEEVAGARYFMQDAVDRLIHDLHHRIQRASWRDMEDRMEDVERRIEELEGKLDDRSHKSQHLL